MLLMSMLMLMLVLMLMLMLMLRMVMNAAAGPDDAGVVTELVLRLRRSDVRLEQRLGPKTVHHGAHG